MVKAAALLIFLFSQQGYWTAAQDQTVAVRWAAKEPMPAADLVWELGLGNVKVDGGTVAMNAGEQPTTVALKAPAVRVRTAMRWTYRLVQRDGGKVLEAGESAVHVFPADLDADWAKRVGDKKLVVWDEAGGALVKALEAAKVPCSRVDDPARILERPDLILVAADRVDASLFSHEPLIHLAEAGSSVAFFEQQRPERLASYPIGRREPAGEVRFKADHPLLDRLEPTDLLSWVAGARADGRALRPVQLPVDEAALELAWWAREAPGEQPVPIDALLLTRSVGAGRIVLCQLPLGPVDKDPRSGVLVGNLLSYLTTRPEPTPPASQRRETPPPAPQPVPTIDFSPGGKP